MVIRNLLILLLVSFPLFSQAVLEQWGCDTVIAATNSNPVTLTCNTPHGFAAGASWKVQMYGATGPWGALNTWVHTQLLTSLQVTDTVAYVNEADPQEVGQHVGFFCLNKTPEDAVVTAKTSNSLTVTRSSPVFHYLNSAMVTNSCDNQVFLNYNRPRLQTATATGPNTFTVPVNSSSFGRFSGPITVRRTTGIPRVYGTDYDGASNTVGLRSSIAGGVFTESIPGIANPNDPKDVVRSTSGTLMGIFAGAISPNSATVSGGYATISLAPWPYQAERPIKAGGFIYIDGFQNNVLNNGFIISSATGAPPTAFRIPVALPDGAYPGVAAGAKFGLPRPGVLNPDFEPADNNGTWSYPSGLLQGFIKSGNWDPAFNRMQIWMKLKNTNVQRRSDNGYIGSFGTYEKRHSDRVNAATPQYDEHWYHYTNHNFYDDVWVLATLNQHPTHQVGSSGGWDWGVDPTFAGFVGYPGYLGDATHYFDGMGRIYIDMTTSTVPTFAGASMSLGPITLSKTAGEPDSSVFTVLASWSPRRFAQVGGCRYEAQAGQPACTGARSRGPGFEVTWNVPSFATIAYEVRRSGTSMKTAGFNSGLCNNGTTCTAANGDIVTGGGGGGHNVVQWSSSDTASTPPAATYIAIRPRFPVMSVSGKGVSPIWISTHVSMDMAVKDRVTVSGVAGNTAANQTNVEIVDSIPLQSWFRFDPVGTAICSIGGSNPTRIKTCSPHRLSEGATVRVDQVQGIAAANGAFTVHVVDATTVELPVSVSGRYTTTPYGFIHGPGMLSSIDASRGVCSVTTTAPHGLKPSMWVMVSGSTNAILGQLPQGAETNWQITAVEDGNHFRFACPKVPDGTYSQDYQKNYPFSLRVFPAIAIAGTGNGEWTTGGTVVSTEPTRNFTETKVTALPQ